MDVLTEKGKLFSENLSILLNEEKIDFIAYVEGKDRCYDTIRHIESINNIKANSYTKAEFNMQIPLPIIAALKHDVSIICYGTKESKMLFKFFDINPKDKDYTYEVIYKIDSDSNIEEISTGY